MEAAVQSKTTSTAADHPDLEKEVELIHRTAEKQLASVNGLNASLVKKIFKSEAQTNALLAQNKDLEGKNADLISQLHRAQDDVRNLSIKEARLIEIEKKYAEAKSDVVNLELAVKKGQAQLDAVVSERDTLESETATLRRQVDDLDNQLKVALDLAEKEKADRLADLEERSIQISALSQEKEDERKTREALEKEIGDRDLKVDQANRELNFAMEENRKATEQADQRVKEAEARLELLTIGLEEKTQELEELKRSRDLALGEKATLEKDVVALMTDNDNLKNEVALSEGELISVKDSLTRTQRERDFMKEQLDEKVAETTEYAARMARLREELAELSRQRDELEAVHESTRRDADAAKVELKSRNERLNSVEGERNLLASEKTSLLKDYADARDRSTLMEREKGNLEKRLYELEELTKNLMIEKENLEQDKRALVTAHEKELHDQLARKQAEFELNTSALRKELDDVVDRHRAMHHAESEREAAAAAAVSVDEDEPMEVEMVTTTVTTTVIESKPVQEASFPDDEDINNEPTTAMIDPTTPVTVQTEEASRSLPTDLIGPDVPTDIPEAPLPYVPQDTDDHERTPGEAGTLLLTRDREMEEEDDDDLDDPVEGDTTGIVSEKVMQEEVVEEPNAGDDVVEEVDEEGQSPAEEAEQKKLAMGVKPDVAEMDSEPPFVDAQGPVDDTLPVNRVNPMGIGEAPVTNTNIGEGQRLQAPPPATRPAVEPVPPGSRAGRQGRSSRGKPRGSSMLSKVAMCCGKN